MNAVFTRLTRLRIALTVAIVAVGMLVAQAVGGLASAHAGSDGTHPSGTFGFHGSLLVGCPTGAVLCTQGTMSGGLNGTFTLTLVSLLPAPDPGVTYFTGTLVLHSAGNVLRCNLDGALNNSIGSEGEFGEICVINGGTGIYAKAKGDLRLIGTSTSTLGIIPTGTGIFQGTIKTT